MQIHELTRKKQLNEVDIAGPDGLIAGAKAAYGALKQKGGAKDALRTVTPGQSQGAFGTADLTQSDFAKRMQAVKNNAAMKQVAVNIQKQWEQTRKTLPAAQSAPATAPTKSATPPATTTPAQTSTTSAPGYSSAKTNAPAGIPSVGGSKLPQPTVATQPKTATPAKPATAPANNNAKTVVPNANVSPNKPGLPGASELDKFNQRVAQALKQQPVTEQLTEAASLAQITDWFTKSVIPRSAAGHEAEYLQNPTIQATLKNIVAAENQPDDKERQKSQAAEFLNLVSAVAAETQIVQAKNPQVAAAASVAAPQAAGVQAATTQLQRLAGLNPGQIEAIKKIFAGAPTVTTGDPNTANFLQAFGIKTS